jgi:Regulator of G protein signaling domain
VKPEFQKIHETVTSENGLDARGCELRTAKSGALSLHNILCRKRGRAAALCVQMDFFLSTPKEERVRSPRTQRSDSASTDDSLASSTKGSSSSIAPSWLRRSRENSNSPTSANSKPFFTDDESRSRASSRETEATRPASSSKSASPARPLDETMPTPPVPDAVLLKDAEFGSGAGALKVALYAYAKRCFCSENISFLSARRYYLSKLADSEPAASDARRAAIIKLFVSDNADMQVNLSSALKVETVKRAEQSLDNCFDAAADEICKLMSTDIWPKFVRSKEYAALTPEERSSAPTTIATAAKLNAEKTAADGILERDSRASSAVTNCSTHSTYKEQQQQQQKQQQCESSALCTPAITPRACSNSDESAVGCIIGDHSEKQQQQQQAEQCCDVEAISVSLKAFELQQQEQQQQQLPSCAVPSTSPLPR